MVPTIHRTFWLITLTTAICLLVYKLLQYGMFVDGVTYASISKNMANGIGGFWTPHYTGTLYPAFYEHPPLAFGIQSLFFTLLGNSMYVERLYSFLTAVLSSIGIIALWRFYFNNTPGKKYAWLPVLLWIATPVIFWSYANNMLENTLTIFTLYATYFIAKAIQQSRYYLIPAVLCLLLAFLTKGFVALFPFVIPIIHSAIYNKAAFSKSVIYTLFLCVGFGLLLIMIWIISPLAYNNFTHYMHEQVLPSLTNKREAGDTRFYILYKTIIELSPSIIIMLLIMLNEKYGVKRINDASFKLSLFFLMIGVCASFPLMITLKQHGHYLVTAIPYYVLSFSCIMQPYIEYYIDKVKPRVVALLHTCALILFILAFASTLLFKGDYSRDKDVIQDVDIICRHLPQGTIISTPNNLCANWGLIAYFSRTNNISLDCKTKHTYYLTSTNNIPDTLYNKTPVLKLNMFNLYKQNK